MDTTFAANIGPIIVRLMIYAMFYCGSCNRGTHYLVKTNFWRPSAVRPCDSSLVFRVLCCRFVPELSICHTTRATATKLYQQYQQMNKKCPSFTVFYMHLPFCIRFDFSGTWLTSRPECRLSCFTIFLSFCMQIPVYYCVLISIFSFYR